MMGSSQSTRFANATRAAKPRNPVQVTVNAEHARSTTVVPREQWTGEAHDEGWNNKANTPMKSRSDDGMTVCDRLEADGDVLECGRYQNRCGRHCRCDRCPNTVDGPEISQARRSKVVRCVIQEEDAGVD